MDLPLQRRTGFENWRHQRKKGGRKDELILVATFDLTNDRNLCVFRSDGVFGNHRRAIIPQNMIYDFMSEKRISVTEAARNFAGLRQSRSHPEGNFVCSECSPVARLVPDAEKNLLGSRLAEALGEAELGPRTEAKGLSTEIMESAQKTFKAPMDKWR